MSNQTKIDWVRNADGSQGATWNCVRGCSKISQGCAQCFALRMAARFSERWALPPIPPLPGVEDDDDLRRFAEMREGKPHWTGRVELIHEKLEEPLHWKKPRTIFVNSMSDLFHESLPDEAIDKVFAVMGEADQHVYLILTKRPARMLKYMLGRAEHCTSWRTPPHNVWLGCSIENQATADERIPLLLKTPAALRFVSVEPCLSRIDLLKYLQGENKHERCGKNLPNSSCIGNIQRGQRGTDVETRGNDWREQDGWSIISAAVRHAEEGRNEYKDGIPNGYVFGEPDSHGGCGTSHCVDGNEPLQDTERDGTKPQRRGEGESSPIQPGGCYKIAERVALLSGVGEKTEIPGGGKKCNGETNRISSIGNQGNVQEQINGPIADCQEIRDYAVGGIMHPPASKLGIPSISFVIAGCESGPHRRPADIAWLRSLRDQCVAAGTPYFLKQMDVNGKLVKMPELDGKVWDQMPE